MERIDPDAADDPVGTATVGDGSDGGLVVTIAGEVDLSVVDEMREVILPALADAPDVAMDLSGVEFLDSSGITLLLEIGRKAGVVTVRALSEPARMVLEATGLGSWFSGAQ